MGGFLYIAKESSEAVEAVAARYQTSLEALKCKGLRLKHTIAQNGFVLFLFDKAHVSSDNFLSLPNDDFICATGTFIYRQQTGAKGLRNLYDDFSTTSKVFNDLRGHFCVLLRKNGQLYIFNDFGGVYHVFGNPTRTVISNSFLALVKSLPKKSVSTQELYEYVLFGGMYGDKTLIREITLLNSQQVYQLPDLSSHPKSIKSPVRDSSSNSDLVASTASELTSYFEVLKKNFGDDACSGLSGGYDSRLMLALMRKVRINPKLYVYGAADSLDVRIAQEIARSENLPISYFDRKNGTPVSLDQFRETLLEQFHFVDGRGVSGTFSHGTDAMTRKARVESAPLHLNGGGGEIYRNFWKLPDRSLTAEMFVRIVYEQGVAHRLPALTSEFSPKGFFETFSDKIKVAVGAKDEKLTRPMIESVYPAIRLKYWMGSNNSSNNLLSYSVTPFAEPAFTIPSGDIPFRFKCHGQFESALIRELDVKLAKYPSTYGFNFFDPISWSARVKNQFRYQTRYFLRPVLPTAVFTRIMRRQHVSSLPYYAEPRYLKQIFPETEFAISQYIDLKKVTDAEQLNRALTAEIVLQNCF
ncbi:MAG: hypothetical protein JWM68_979 [Verrucomicrobiales bacterium]|nr:hypothetical protein [Verrucomicrobiales bacterium]